MDCSVLDRMDTDEESSTVLIFLFVSLKKSYCSYSLEVP